MRSPRGFPSIGGGRITGRDEGCRRDIDFDQIQSDPRVIAAHSGEDDDLEDDVPLIRQWVLRATQTKILAGGQGGGDEGIGVHVSQQDVPEQETMDSLRAQIDQLRARVQTFMTERDRAVRRQQDTQGLLDHI